MCISFLLDAYAVIRGDGLGYKIRYTSCKVWDDAASITYKPRKKLVCLFVGIACVAIFAMMLHHKDAVLDLLVPGDLPTTVAAWQTLLANLRSGTPAKEAITVFCTEILEYAQR